MDFKRLFVVVEQNKVHIASVAQRLQITNRHWISNAESNETCMKEKRKKKERLALGKATTKNKQTNKTKNKQTTT